jgi:hypothetical protein
MNDNYDWERFWIHFVFGALVGGLIGIAIWGQGWFWVIGTSLVVATLGGVYGDRFWEWFLESLRWIRWW